jgi:hypothetical protein
MNHSGKSEIPRIDIDTLHRDLGTTQENIQLKLKGSAHDKYTARKHINDKRLTDRLLEAGWITPEQKEKIVKLNKTLKSNSRSGGKRRCSTRSKKYKKNNKRSKRTRTLRRKRYSRKS